MKKEEEDTDRRKSLNTFNSAKKLNLVIYISYPKMKFINVLILKRRLLFFIIICVFTSLCLSWTSSSSSSSSSSNNNNGAKPITNRPSTSSDGMQGYRNQQTGKRLSSDRGAASTSPSFSSFLSFGGSKSKTKSQDQREMRLAVGIISIYKSDRPLYIYSTLTSIFEALLSTKNTHPLLIVDVINVFVGSDSIQYLELLKYSNQVKLHPLVWADFNQSTPHIQASYNYGRSVRYLYENYGPSSSFMGASDRNGNGKKQKTYDGLLLLEDDIIMDPSASYQIYDVLAELDKIGRESNDGDRTPAGSSSNTQPKNWIVDGYVSSLEWTQDQQEQEEIQEKKENEDAANMNLNVDPSQAPAGKIQEPVPPAASTAYIIKAVPPSPYRCCTQAMLFSPNAAFYAYQAIERAVNGIDPFLPYDHAMTSYLFGQVADFKLYVVSKAYAWVQHVGGHSTLKNVWHCGISEMDFDIKDE